MKWEGTHPYEQVRVSNSKDRSKRCECCNKDATYREMICRYLSAWLCPQCAKQAREVWTGAHDPTEETTCA